MSYFSSIPVRVNGDTVLYSWFNTIRTYLINYFGTGALGETSFVLPNNQGSPLNITGLLFDSSAVRTAVVTYEVSRKTDTGGSELRSVGKLFLGYRVQTSAWEILDQQEFGDDSGVTLSVTAVGQVQYTSTNVAGSNYLGTLKFRGETFNA